MALPHCRSDTVPCLERRPAPLSRAMWNEKDGQSLQRWHHSTSVRSTSKSESDVQCHASLLPHPDVRACPPARSSSSTLRLPPPSRLSVSLGPPVCRVAAARVRHYSSLRARGTSKPSVGHRELLWQIRVRSTPEGQGRAPCCCSRGAPPATARTWVEAVLRKHYAPGRTEAAKPYPHIRLARLLSQRDRPPYSSWSLSYCRVPPFCRAY